MSDTLIKERAGTDQADSAADAKPRTKRTLLLSLLAASIAIGGAGWGGYYYTTGRYFESTDDAYVSGNLVQLTPEVSGTVVAVNADDTQIVRQGEPVVTLDAADAKVALSNAEANLAQTVRQVSSL
ncbi:hypothetical protein BSFA1_83460 (plasmid) [Burkholderia sp. SFA1]|nr:hypothetical protein BSFA1_83460 [Burkholderia sp. SFA1]